MTPPNRESVTYNAERGRYDWAVTLPSGVELSGHADTADQARRDMRKDWRVRGEKPRYITARLPCGGIEPRGGETR